MTFFFLLILVFFMPFEVDLRHQGINLPVINTSLEILFVLLLAAWLAERIKRKDYRLKATALDIPILIFLVWHIVSGMFSVNVAWSLKYIFKMFAGIIFYYIIIDTVKEEKQLKKIVLSLLFSAVIVGALGIGERLIPGSLKNILDVFCPGHFYLPESFTIRAKSTFIYPNIFAMYLEMVIFIASGLLFGRFLRFPAFVLLLTAEALMLTYSRGGLIAVYGALALLLCLSTGREFLKVKRRNIFFIGITITGLFLLTMVFDNVLARRVGSVFDKSYNANRERVYLWKCAVEMIKARPLTGVGPDGYRWVYDDKYAVSSPFSSLTNPGGIPSANSNNMYLEMAANLGIPGALMFLWVLISIVNCQLKWFKKQEAEYSLNVFMGLSAGIWAFYIHGLVDSFWQFQSIILLFWLITGLTVLIASGRYKCA